MIKQSTLRKKRRKVLFVVGAGASFDFGFPLGAALADEIQSRLDVEFNESGGVGPHATPILAALGSSRTDSQYLDAARQLRAGIGVQESIDQFLMKRRNNQFVRNLGLMTLAQTILDAERKSLLNGYNGDWESSLSARRATTMSWPAVLMAHLIGDRTPEEVNPDTFSDVAFVIFNYDRCVEQSFLHRLRVQQHLVYEDALAIVKSIPMIHVYGTLGEIDGKVKFGAAEAPIADISKTLRTYHDGVVDKQHARKIHSLITNAEKIVFLGFGFHRENVKLLFPKGLPNARLIGTAIGCQNVPAFREISAWTDAEFFDANPTNFLLNNGFRLMSESWKPRRRRTSR